MNIFLITIAFLPFLFGYPSQKQALKACEEWESKGVVHFYESYSYLRKQWVNDGGKISSRVCLNKEAVNQILGKESKIVKKAKSWNIDTPTPIDYKVKRRFRY